MHKILRIVSLERNCQFLLLKDSMIYSESTSLLWLHCCFDILGICILPAFINVPSPTLFHLMQQIKMATFTFSGFLHEAGAHVINPYQLAVAWGGQPVFVLKGMLGIRVMPKAGHSSNIVWFRRSCAAQQTVHFQTDSCWRSCYKTVWHNNIIAGRFPYSAQIKLFLYGQLYS